MPKDPINTICEKFTDTANSQELVFWKGDVLYSIAEVIYYRFEELLDCYPERPDVIKMLLTRIRDIYERFSDMSSSYQARMKLSDDMIHSHISFSAALYVSWISKACIGYSDLVQDDLNLSFLDLKPHRASLRRLAGICLTHFEQRIAEQITNQKPTRETQTDSPSSRRIREIETPSPTASPKA